MRFASPAVNWLWVKTKGIQFWLVGEFTTHFRTYFSGWIESDVYWGYDLDFDPLPPPAVGMGQNETIGGPQVLVHVPLTGVLYQWYHFGW